MRRHLVAAAAICLMADAPVSTQITAIKDGPIVYGHHHLTVSSFDAARRFWVDTLGAKSSTLATTRFFVLPNVLIFVNEQTPTGGSKGTTVNHVGFQVPDIRAAVDRVKAAVPLKRLGEPAEIAATAVFIAENDFVTGRVVEVDGGLRL